MPINRQDKGIKCFNKLHIKHHYDVKKGKSNMNKISLIFNSENKYISIFNKNIKMGNKVTFNFNFT